ncbi:hypothetical protein F3Y22_tig00110783pilonHSYRG00256 [Hibiscus syriacus]|uniref:Uncharacterized protein n=1 Tax=Hibiscus syriacus TaxID=106335 RepID=A0A6A2ZRC5_HIBSY|nr:hypothetical protein F3Y22_tig00110783pilonHSYRG00256 [Hibiscus syriacus]
MPTIKVKESGRKCSICLDEFGVDEEAREMPCGDGGPGRLEGGENVNGLEVFQSVLTSVGLASFMGVVGSGRVDDDVSFT